MGKRELYPNQVVYFVKNSDGDIVQRSLEYSGCFDDSLEFDEGETFEFEITLEENEELDSSKGIVFKYSDTSFRSYDITFFEEI